MCHLTFLDLQSIPDLLFLNAMPLYMAFVLSLISYPHENLYFCSLHGSNNEDVNWLVGKIDFTSLYFMPHVLVLFHIIKNLCFRGLYFHKIVFKEIPNTVILKL